MHCPQCGKIMKYVSRSYRSIVDCDFDYDINYYIYYYSCINCGIKCVVRGEGYNDVEDWSIPQKFLPTEKQIKTVLFIKNTMGLEENIHKKNKHGNLSKNISKNLKI